MRMRELEKRTGIGRETIRYYLRKGLLPEPERKSVNSARYNEDHVIRLKAIRRLQEERYLPLEVIKTLLDSQEPKPVDVWLYPNMEDILQVRTGLVPGRKLSIAEAAQQTGLTEEEIGEISGVGVVDLSSDRRLESTEMAILQCFAELKRSGFTKEKGFQIEDFRIYVEVVQWLAENEVRTYFAAVQSDPDLSEEEVINQAALGISLINQLITLMHPRVLLKKLHQIKIEQQDDDT